MVVQDILVFGSETWVVAPHMGLLLGGFHYMMERRLLGMQLCIWTDGRWE